MRRVLRPNRDCESETGVTHCLIVRVKQSNWDCESKTGVTSNQDCEHETDEMV